MSSHPIAASNWTHKPGENPNTMPDHATCVDCHNPHATTSAPASAPAVPGPLRGVAGLNSAGSTVAEANYEYEVCFKCHGVRDQSTSFGIVRNDNNRNVRLEVSQSNPSHHAVTGIGNNPNVSGFEPGYSASSVIYCTDCHNNSDSVANTIEPRGPHGSAYSPILERQYDMNDFTLESFQSYELCYKCHNRSFLINDQANTFLHDTHVQGGNAPCAACHDAHGSRQNQHLINFMRIDTSGNSVVSPSSSTGRLEYNSLGVGSGECYLECHGVDHGPFPYP